jgi:DNA repair protein RadC
MVVSARIAAGNIFALSGESEMSSDKSREGHRKRLREKFTRSGLAGFGDCEIVELLLTMGSPRKDCKEQAKEAIKRFKSLRGVLEASPEELQQVDGIGPHNSFGIKLVLEAARAYLKEKIAQKPIYTSAQEIFDYLYYTMRGLKKEIFRVLYLDSQNQVIDTVDLFTGTVNSSAISPREVMESAIKYNAASLIFVHNHPSGNSGPSLSDREATRVLVFAAASTQTKVLDHIIIGDNTYFSFADEGLIELYETDSLSLGMEGTPEAKQRLYRAKLFGGLD